MPRMSILTVNEKEALESPPDRSLPGSTSTCTASTISRPVVCVKFCKKYFRKIQFSSVDRRRACGNVGKLSVLGEAFPSLRGNPCLLADFL